MKKLTAALIFAAFVSIPTAAFAADPAIALRNDAPLYSGQAQEGDLEELTAEDYEEFGTESDTPAEQYRQYQKVLEQPAPGTLVLYKMRVVDHELTLDDFLGFGVPEELSEARYDGYLSMEPVTVDGRTIHYVYVYHCPLVQTESEALTS